VSSAFIINVQSNLEPDPNDPTAAYMRILIHATNASLFPDPPSDGVVTIRSCHRPIPALGQPPPPPSPLPFSHYLPNREGSTTHNRQQKFDELEKEHFWFVIEGLPVMLQLFLLSLPE